MRRWPGWVRVRDAALVAVALVIGWQDLQQAQTTPGPMWLAGLAMLPGVLALPWRRSHAWQAWLVAVVPNLLYWLAVAAPENGALLLSLAVVVYAVGRWDDNRRRSALLAILTIPILVVHEWRDPSNTDLIELLKALPYDAVGVVAWLLGAFLRVRLEQREANAERIAAAERTRIARELHDIVAHGISVMVVQAEAAAEILDADPQRARLSMERVADTGRASLVELRRALGMLRANARLDGAPQPGLARVPELVRSLRDTGLQIEVSTTGRVADLEPGIDVALYRVIQESLTNTLRHSNARRVAVEIDRAAGSVGVRITDDGRSAGDAVHLGGGLLGIKERVAMLGGEVRAGRAAGGGFEVAVTVPIGGAQ